VDGAGAAVPLAGELLDGADGQPHVLALGGLVDVLVVDPAPAVAGDLVAQLDEGGGEVRVACSAMPMPNTVSGSWRFSNSRRMRQTPAREPYS
jgi:hypothetical protein